MIEHLAFDILFFFECKSESAPHQSQERIRQLLAGRCGGSSKRVPPTCVLNLLIIFIHSAREGLKSYQKYIRCIERKLCNNEPSQRKAVAEWHESLLACTVTIGLKQIFDNQ